MKKLTYVSLMTLTSGVWIGSSAQAQYTYFSDNFDNKVNPLDPPQVGYGYEDNGTTGSPFSLSTNPALGKQSLEIQRSGNTQGTLQVIGLNGALVDGNTVTFSWDEYIGYLYNAPVQVNLGYSPYSTGSLDLLGINDNPGGNEGTYFFYTDQNGDEISTGVKPTVDGWDHLTVVMDLSEYYVAGGPNYMTGTMDFYVALNGGAEQELASNVALPYAQIPTFNPMSAYDNSTDAGMQIQEGPGANTYYDNLLITGTDAPAAPLPEPPLTWNNTGGTGDGMTWDYDINQNWNNGTGPTGYIDNSDITFNDQNNGKYAVNLVTTVSPKSVTFDNNSAAYTISGTGSIIGAGSLTMSGTSMVFLNNTGSNTYTGGTDVTSGTLVIGAAGALPTGYGVSITGGTLQLAANTGGETLSSLSISAGGFLDVGNNHVIISDPGGSIDATIRGYLANGYNNGNWNGISGTATGGGIGTSSATGTKYGIGYADGADGGISGISSGQLEVKYTLYGDANLDGSVNSIDFGDMAANFGKSGKVWDQGDFNYDGTVNSVDFGLLAGNFGKSVGGNADVTAADWAALDAFAAANGLMADVPEPASASLILFTGLGVLTRRRRRKND